MKPRAGKAINSPPRASASKDDERTLLLLQQKLAHANTMGNVCMTWWVSSVVFCGSILAAVWWNKAELSEPEIVNKLGIFLLLFFAGVVIFGALIMRLYLRNLRKDLSKLLKKPGEKDFFSTELSTFWWAMFIGTVSFLLILIAWVFLWGELRSGRWKKKEPQAGQRIQANLGRIPGSVSIEQAMPRPQRR